MPNAIKYSTTGDTQSLKKGNFFIGVGDVGKGPTSTTNYYNGITPSTGGYTIYLNKTSGGPSIYVASSDSQLIDFTNKIAGSSYTTTSQCLTYYSTQTDKMVLNRDYESIVTSGLTLNLDAGFTPSYPTTGTTWYDLSYSGNNGTLINNPTYNSTDGGSIVFDGVDEYVSVNSGSNILSNVNYTKTAWFYVTNFATSNNIISSDGGGQHAFWLASGNKLNSGHNGAWSTVVSTTTLSLNTWYFGSVTFSTTSGWNLYLNGVQESTSVDTTTFTGIGDLSVGSFWGGNFFTGRISVAQIYNRILSASEILQNYTAIKSRFSFLDPDAQAFITAAVITGSTQQNAINTLVISLKGYGIWVKMNAIYPFVGGTASQHKFNLKNPLDTDAAFRLVFNGGWVHSISGITGNGTNTFADTKLKYTTLNSGHQSLYSRSNVLEATTPYDMGAYNVSWQILSLHTYNLSTLIGGFNSDSQPRSSMLDSSGLFINNRTSSNAANLWRNDGKLIQSTQAVGMIPNLNNYIGAVNSGGSAIGVASKNYAFSSIGSGLTDTEAVNYYTAVQTFQTTLGRQVGVPIVSDSDAQAFLNAAIITGTTQANAVNTLVIDLKLYGVWTKMKSLYPFVGGTASQHKFNLKNPLDTDAAFRLVFNGGWTHSSTGALPNGTNAYANTYLNPLTQSLSKDSTHIAYYRRNTQTDSKVLMSAMSVGVYLIRLNLAPNYTAGFGNICEIVSQTDQQSGTAISELGLINGNRISSTQFKVFANSILKQTFSRTSTLQVNANIYISSENYGGTPGGYTNNECALASIGEGLTDTEAVNYNTAVEKFQTTLGRNSTVPVVSDADAQAFLNAAYITDTTQATAVNTLVTSLKGYGIWTKMKALYPFVGGTATTHKFNLKNPLDTDAAFRLTFNGGWTHSTTGAKPNGTNAYANTFLIPNTSLQLNSAHISFYSRTNTASWCDIGSSNASLQNGIYMLNNCPGNINYSSFFFGGSNYISPGYTRGDGFFSLRRNNSTQYVSSRNSVNTTYAFNTASKTTFPIYISSLNNGGANVDYSVRECAIASIGDGLSDIEHDNYNTAVQVFQTSLSRNV